MSSRGDVMTMVVRRGCREVFHCDRLIGRVIKAHLRQEWFALDSDYACVTVTRTMRGAIDALVTHDMKPVDMNALPCMRGKN